MGRLLTRPRGMCPRCISRLDSSLKQLPLDVLELNVLVGASTAVGRTSDAWVTGTRELPSPIREGIFDLRAQLCSTAWDAATLLASIKGGGVRLVCPEGPFDPAALRVKAAVAFLRPRIDDLVDLLLQDALELQELHHRVRVLAGRTRLVHRLTPACPWCDHKALVRHNGSDMVQCEHCEKQVDERHYSWFVHTIVSQQGDVA